MKSASSRRTALPPCGQSPMPLSVAGGGRAPSAIVRQDGHPCQPSARRTSRATAALRRLIAIAFVSPVSRWRMHASVRAGACSPRTGSASAHAAQYAAGAVRTALVRPRPPSDARESRQGRCAVRPARQDSAEAGLQGLPYGVVVGLCVAGYIQRRHCAQRVVGPRRCAHSEKKPRALQIWEARQLAQSSRSVRIRLSAHADVKCGCPMGVPRSEDNLFPRQTSALSSAIPSGSSLPAWLYTRVLPSLETMPHSTCTACTVVSRASRARSHVVRTYKSRNARSGSEVWSADEAWHKAACWPRASSAGASGSPCSHPSPCMMSRQCPESSHQQYVEGRL